MPVLGHSCLLAAQSAAACLAPLLASWAALCPRHELT